MKFRLRSAMVFAASVAALAAGSGAPARTPGGRTFFLADKPASDDSIHDQVIRKLANDPDVKGGGLNIDVKEGVVTLRGKVETEKQRQKAERLAKRVSGVKKVINEITLRK